MPLTYQAIPEQFERLLQKRIQNQDLYPRYVLLGRSFNNVDRVWLHESGCDLLIETDIAPLAVLQSRFPGLEAHDIFCEGLALGFPAYQETCAQLAVAGW
ncbi:MAG: hypothetical protein H7A00_08320 [Hahellaceae bacterium]|nr:hypothetical protein [Hahellaceae bacterium]